MTLANLLLIGALTLGGLLVLLRLVLAVRSYRRFRGKMLITCPESKTPEAVDVQSGRAALTALVGTPSLRLKDCTRWPERADCGQDCLAQVADHPQDCLVRNIVARWYEGKDCAFCGKSIATIDWLKQRPALLSPDRRTVQWDEVHPERLPEVFATHRPVCWNCHIAESFRREHPERVVDRPPHDTTYVA